MEDWSKSVDSGEWIDDAVYLTNEALRLLLALRQKCVPFASNSSKLVAEGLPLSLHVCLG